MRIASRSISFRPQTGDDCGSDVPNPMTKKIEETIIKPSEHKFLKENINNCKETPGYYHWGGGGGFMFTIGN
jgi:hypothetical protein